MNIGVEMDRQVDWFIGSLIGLLGVYVGLIWLFIELDYIGIRENGFYCFLYQYKYVFILNF